MSVFCKSFSRSIRTGVLFSVLIMVHIASLALAADSAGTPGKKMTKRQISKLAESYISAVESRNVKAWQEMLSQMHPNAAELNEQNFLKQVETVESLLIDEVDGFNVQLRLRYASGERRTGTLQMDPAGRIKYTPFCFKHPLYEVCEKLELMLHDRVTIMGATSSPASRAVAAYTLQSMGIPLFDYAPYTISSQERLAAAQKIMEWLKENGQKFDTTEPKCFLPPDVFKTLMNNLQTAVR